MRTYRSQLNLEPMHCNDKWSADRNTTIFQNTGGTGTVWFSDVMLVIVITIWCHAQTRNILSFGLRAPQLIPAGIHVQCHHSNYSIILVACLSACPAPSHGIFCHLVCAPLNWFRLEYTSSATTRIILSFWSRVSQHAQHHHTKYSVIWFAPPSTDSGWNTCPVPPLELFYHFGRMYDVMLKTKQIL